MKLRIILILGFCLGWALGSAQPGLAQSSATLSGVVLKPSGALAVRAEVQVSGAGLRLTGQTDEHGRFLFPGLPVGEYALRAATPDGAAFSMVDLPSGGAIVTLQLLKTVGSVRSTTVPVTRGSGTDVVLNQTAIAHSPAYASLPDLLLQLPGAARGANGAVHINGDHGDINYVVDGVSIPQALNREVGTEIDPSDIAFMDVLEGAYPAQYGGRFAAVINIDTKASRGPAGVKGYVTAGSYASYDTDIEYHSPIGRGSIEIASRQGRASRALDPPNFQAAHDNGSDANQFIRYAVPFGNDFLLASGTHALQTFQIPNDIAGGEPAATDDDETQDDTFLNLQYHHTTHASGAVVYGLAYKRSRIRDSNDPLNDFAYGTYSLFSNRTASDVIVTVDGTAIEEEHALKYGATYDASNVRKLYAVSFGVATVVDDAPNVGHTESAYVQDTWSMGKLWRADYGVRADSFQIASAEFARGFSQINPRVKITRLYGRRADIYAYAGRFFTPFSFENVSPAAAQRLNVPLQPNVAQFDLRPQRDTDIEVGGNLPFGRGQLGLRLMQKRAIDVIDDTQVATTVLHQDINYARGNITVQSVDYQQALASGGRAYFSVTHTRSVNKGCETQLLAPCFGAPSDWTPADHDQRWSGAGGVSRTDRRNGWWSMTGEYGSGLSSAYCQPASDTCKVPPHTTFDLERGIAMSPNLTLTLGAYDVLNDRYRITYLNAQGNHYASGRTFRLGLRFTR